MVTPLNLYSGATEETALLVMLILLTELIQSHDSNSGCLFFLSP